MKRIFLVIVISYFTIFIYGQNNVNFSIKHLLKNNTLYVESMLVNNNPFAILIHAGGITKEDGVVFKPPISFFKMVSYERFVLFDKKYKETNKIHFNETHDRSLGDFILLKPGEERRDVFPIFASYTPAPDFIFDSKDKININKIQIYAYLTYFYADNSELLYKLELKSNKITVK